MKVIQIMPEFGLAGAEILCETLSAELAKLGADVVIISFYDYRSPITERLEQQEIPVYYCHKKPGFDPGMVVRLYQIFKREKPDVIHTHLRVTPYAIPAALLAGVKKRVHTVHNIAAKEATAAVQRLNSFFFRFNHVIPVALSVEIRKTVRDRYRIPAEKIPVIFNGIDLNKCIAKTSYIHGGKLRFIHVGRFSEQKNHFMLIEAFGRVHRMLPDTELILIGRGELEGRAKEKVREMGLTGCIHFHGVTDNVYPLLHSADVFILPSKYEGMPISLIEAMATGLPVIASGVGGVPSMIENEADGLLTKGEIDSVVNAMLRMADGELRERLGRAARKKAARLFSSQAMAEKYLQIYSL